MPDRVRDWTEEPWRHTWGEHEGDYRIAEITDVFDARRADEAVNAMKGWSASEGEVGRLLDDLQVMRGLLATGGFDANSAALMLEYHLGEFKRVEEPS